MAIEGRKLFYMSHFSIFHNVLLKSTAADASESVYLWKRVTDALKELLASSVHMTNTCSLILAGDPLPYT